MANLIRNITAARLAFVSIGVVITGGFIGNLYKINTEFDAMHLKLNAAIPEINGGAREFHFLSTEADRMGVQLRSITGEYSKFSASALRSGISLKDTRQIFKDMSEAAVSLRMDNTNLVGVFNALGQMAGKGVVSMEEIKLQLGDRLPGAVNIAAKSIGLTTQEFIKMVSEGKILSNEFIPKFAQQIKNELGGAFEDASQSTVANMNRLSNGWDNLKNQFGMVFTSNAFIYIVNDLVKFLDLTNKLIGVKKELSVVEQNISNIQGELSYEEQISVLAGLQKQEKEKTRFVNGSKK